MTVTALLLALAVYPLLEEWLFRGMLLRELDQRFLKWRGWRTNLAVSILFGLAHAVAWPISHAAAVVLPSLLFGWLWQRYQRLWLCVAVHAACNVVPLIFPVAW